MPTFALMTTPDDELGAHVSTAGGVVLAPARAREIGAAVLQLFTKQPSRWAEPEIDAETALAFAAARAEHRITVAGAHDSYLINLASPDRRLWRLSERSFLAELERCTCLALDFLVTHPGNAMTGSVEEAIERNARGITESLDAVGDGPTRILLELTAGTGTSIGSSFENLRAIIERIPSRHRRRVGVCFDTCHAHSAGYDLIGDYDGVWNGLDGAVGLDRLGLIHLNDSKHPFGSRKDRHEGIGRGTIGEGPFRRIMTDERLRDVPKVIETPKGDDRVTADRANLALLRGFRNER